MRYQFLKLLIINGKKPEVRYNKLQSFNFNILIMNKEIDWIITTDEERKVISGCFLEFTNFLEENTWNQVSNEYKSYNKALWQFFLNWLIDANKIWLIISYLNNPEIERLFNRFINEKWYYMKGIKWLNWVIQILRQEEAINKAKNRVKSLVW